VVLKEDLLMMKDTIRMSRRLIMGSIILTGISHGKHQFSLTYPELEGVMICMAKCNCGYEVEILYFKNYGGIKYLQKMWEIHIGTWKGWV
jgi:hypothetical protein